MVRGGRPFLGICVGMQLLAERGLERGVYDGLGWLGGEVEEIEPAEPALKIPHMGWNALSLRMEHPIFDGLSSGGYAYFVHSYHLRTADAGHTLATVEYGQTITAVVGRDNIVGTQFHPEKEPAGRSEAD